MTQALHEFEVSPAVLERLELAAGRLEDEGPEATIRWAVDEFKDSIAIATGFGAEGVALIDIAARLNPRPVIFFIDTGFLFPETYELRRRLEQRYDIEILARHPHLTPEQQEKGYGPRLWASDPDLCCSMRKLEPLEGMLGGLDAWVTAIRRDQTPARAGARAVEWDRRWQLVKVNPLVRWTKKDVWKYIAEHDVPYNPLHDQGFPSIGCTNCTRAVREGEGERAGRWAGLVKTECGLHG